MFNGDWLSLPLLRADFCEALVRKPKLFFSGQGVDTNGDGELSFTESWTQSLISGILRSLSICCKFDLRSVSSCQEMTVLLREGNPDLTDKEARCKSQNLKWFLLR